MGQARDRDPGEGQADDRLAAAAPQSASPGLSHGLSPLLSSAAGCGSHVRTLGNRPHNTLTPRSDLAHPVPLITGGVCRNAMMRVVLHAPVGR
jgi:hypothetical protein